MKQLRYRTESFSGLHEYDAVKVMAFETYELENTDILCTLRSTILKDHPIANQMEKFEKEIEVGLAYDTSIAEWETFYHCSDAYTRGYIHLQTNTMP